MDGSRYYRGGRAHSGGRSSRAMIRMSWLRGRVYDVVVLVPGGAAGRLVGVLSLAPFQIGPQELLADPADTGRLGQLQGFG